ncbi:hypothetical protein [Ferrimicrobium sp.]|uniref:hypothetical protein n=1 Tax=Ferrimicrobium sp. TaxID=2926050 RepID=UPI00262CC78B|nr:hypothetical protein [Ferrimicrobium sp.]
MGLRISKQVALALGRVLDEVGEDACQPADRLPVVLGLLTGDPGRSALDNLVFLSQLVEVNLENPTMLLDRLQKSDVEQFCDLLVALIELRDPRCIFSIR